MLIRCPHDILWSSITDPAVYAERRHFTQGMPLAAGALGLARSDYAEQVAGLYAGMDLRKYF